jgi:hypothetical protein
LLLVQLFLNARIVILRFIILNEFYNFEGIAFEKKLKIRIYITLKMRSFFCLFFSFPLWVCIFLSGSQLAAQNTIKQYSEGLNIKFDLIDSKKIGHAMSLLDQADVLFEKASQAYAQLTDIEKKERMTDEYQNALKTLFEASETYKEGHSIIYDVYKSKADAFWKKMSKVSHHAAGMDKAHYYEAEALKKKNRALIRREQVLEYDRFEYALLIMNDAKSLEKMSIRNEGRAVQICLDYPVEYNYGWDDDKSLEEIIAIIRDPAVHEPPEDIFATVDKDTKVDSMLFKEIIFKVQIAAHTVPLTQEYLETIYQGDLKIDMIFEDEWYKYSIGRYLDYNEADATLREYNIKKAFVVAYEAGKHIPTLEAIQIVEQQKTGQ